MEYMSVKIKKKLTYIILPKGRIRKKIYIYRMNDDELDGIREDVHKLEERGLGAPFRYILHMA